jgi:Domain of unknown function (DUF2017)
MSDPRLVTRSRHGYVLHLGSEERSVVSRLLDELRGLLRTASGDAPGLERLFPVVHPEHPEQEAEYQRLMREELVASRLGAIDTVQRVLAGSGRKVILDEAQLMAFMQAVNSLRLVLGTVLDVGEDDEPAPSDGPEQHLYGYLSWLLDASVRAVSVPD